jgi:hypothetical protein
MAWGGLADSNMGKCAASSSEDHALALGIAGSLLEPSEMLAYRACHAGWLRQRSVTREGQEEY